MFALVRPRSLKPLGYGVSTRTSEHERTRANAEPCHSCHALSVPDRKVSRIGALGCFGDEHRLRVQQAAVSQEPSLRVVGAILYRKEAWSTTRPNCGSTGWVFTRAETKS